MVTNVKHKVKTFAGALMLFSALLPSGCVLQREKSSRSCSQNYCNYGLDFQNQHGASGADLGGVLPSIAAPLTIVDFENAEYWELSLNEAISMTLGNATVLRELGGQVLRSPSLSHTVHSPAITETDPRFGIEAALSEFDASVATRFFAEKNDRALNNIIFGGGTRLFQQDLVDFSTEVSKRSAVGTIMAARHNIQYDFNNAPGNDIPNKPWGTNVELEVRHPLMRGGGSDFNRIAGPSSAPGFYNGVLIAQIDADISVTEFEAGVRDLISDVETAYWELYFSYRNLDALLGARDQALETWRRIEALAKTGRLGGGAEKESRAREQYFRALADVQNSLAGQIQEQARSTTLRATGGVQTHERALRMLIGVPINDGRVIRPASEPTAAHVIFDWDECLAEASMRRAELRRQRQQIRRRELELVAAKNYLLPQLDLVGRYRLRGLGENLLEPGGSGREFGNAYENLLDGDFQEWQAGIEIRQSVGRRRAHAAVRNAVLKLQRERVILNEQFRQVTLELSAAVAEKERAYLLAQTQLNRRVAAEQQLQAAAALYEGALENQKDALLNDLLDAQRRLADAEVQFARSQSEYMLALKQIHFAKGSLLSYNQIHLAEGGWPSKAIQDADDRHQRRIDEPVGTSYVQRGIAISQ